MSVVERARTGATTVAEAPDRDSDEKTTRDSSGKRKAQPSAQATAGRITKRKKQTKKDPPIGSARDFPCRPCVTRATKAPGHECASQNNTGAACWDCARNGHTCRPVPAGAVAAVRTFWRLNRQIKDTNGDPDDAWQTAAQNAAQQLRAFGVAAASGAVPALALASHGEAAEKTCEERKLLALETIAEAARLWIRLNKPEDSADEEGGDDDN
ncbi:hypothetical protein X797_011134 [Metarhizium robertsii]|uniref:Uncharacterized protein n=1 Tax=Metarhizium robertsii TaxID=568076 RepID=A0A014QSJ9_9HYPO|nr:hypothetical protein X797_011134 [Metarhizium robertsii]